MEENKETAKDTPLTQEKRHKEKSKNSAFETAKDETEKSQQEILPSFTVMMKNGMKQYSGMKAVFFNEESGQYLLDNGKEKLRVSASVMESISHPEKLNFRQLDKPEMETAEEQPAIVKGRTKIPEFAMLTPGGIQTYKNMVVQNYNEKEKIYTLSNKETTITVSDNTFSEITRPERFEKHYGENTPEYEKLIESQYDNYFRQRENTAVNFRHNLSVYCRKEANTPLDALQIAKDLVNRMDRSERNRTEQLLKKMTKEGETINQLIVSTYFEAVKEVPLNQETVLQKRNEDLITTPFYDTISEKGQKVDKDSTLKIGDTVKNLAFNVGKTFGQGKENIYEDLTVISASREGNNIILMDKNRSYYEVPRDSLLKGYNKQQEKQKKAEMKQQKSSRIDVGWER